MSRMRHVILDTFTGPFVVMLGEDEELGTSWLTERLKGSLEHSRHDRRLRPDVVGRLRKYFDGEAVDFRDVEIRGGAAFQRRCWEACRRIPRGVTITYAQLAARAGSPSAFRAAGQAMRHNRLPVIVPCHRVIASGGGLHGFAGSINSAGRELDIKRRLLQMEGAIADEQRLPGPGVAKKRTRTSART